MTTTNHAQRKVCPDHNAVMKATGTKYGPRLSCPVKGCTMACWPGPTSTPADSQTRLQRRLAHAAFDHVWQADDRDHARSRAYKALAEFLGIKRRACHIGMFDAEQCQRVIAFARKWCPDCDGLGGVSCLPCGGEDCDKCGGTGVRDCPAPACDTNSEAEEQARC